MPDYRKLYHMMFNAATDAVYCLTMNDPQKARQILIHAQQDSEAFYVCDESYEPPIELVKQK